MAKTRDLTKGDITAGLWAFALPLMLGNVLQQMYNLVDTWVVGKYIGDSALAAVGSSYTLMTFLTSIIIGLCLGSSSFISMAYGKKDNHTIKNGISMSFISIGILTVLIILIFYLEIDSIIKLLKVPKETVAQMKEYLVYVFIGFVATFIYNYVSNIMRGLGNSLIPLIFLGISVILNIFLDLYFVLVLELGIKGAAIATVIAQYISAAGIFIYFLKGYKEYIPDRESLRWNSNNMKDIMALSGFTCLQQSVMNFGILMVQGIVNSFGQTIMAAFAVAVKIDTIAYMPVQDFGNAFSVFASARILMSIFVSANSIAVIEAGTEYLRIEGAFYIGIGILFMLYGYYRAVNKPVMSVVLTVISLGSRVLLAYILSKIPAIGVIGIWIAIPIGWFLADITGAVYYILKCRKNSTILLHITKN